MVSLVRRRISFKKWLGSLNQTLEWNIFKEKLHHEVVSWHRHPFKHLWPQIHPATHDMVSLTLAYKNYVSVSFIFFKVCTDCLIYCDINSKLLSNRNHAIKKPTELSQFLLFILFFMIQLHRHRVFPFHPTLFSPHYFPPYYYTFPHIITLF